MKKLSLVLALILIILTFTSCKGDSEDANSSGITSLPSLPPVEDYETDVFVSIGIENGFHYVEYSDHVELTDYDMADSVSEIKFPSTIANKPVTKVNITSFAGNTFLTSVQFPNTVLEIGNQVFATCTSLENVKLPEGVQKIGSEVFYDTPWFESLADEFVIVGDGVLLKYNGKGGDVVIPDTVKYVSDALSESSKITSIVIPNSVTGISNYAFYNCSSLSDITIPSHISDIGTHAFDETTWLLINDDEFLTVGNSVLVKYNGNGGDVVIPDTVKYVSGAFNGNENVTSVTVPSSVIRVRSASFLECKNLTKITFEGAYTYIDAAAFAECTHLAEVNLPSKLEVIEDQLFYACPYLVNIKLPDSVKLISRGAFYSCSRLESIEIGNNVTAIDSAAFFGCIAITKIELPDTVEKFGTVPFACCYELTEFNLPPKITEIPLGCFSYCVKIPELRFGEHVTSIGEGAFEGCADLIVYIEGADTTIGKDIFLSCEDGKRKVYCKKGSVAEKYLKENKIKYSIIKE